MDVVPAPTIDPAKRPWAISAIVLGGLTLLSGLWGLTVALKPGTMPVGFSTETIGFGVASALIALGFLLGGILSILGHKIGLTLLTYAPIAAIAFVILYGYYQYTFFNSDAYSQFLVAKYVAAGMTADAATALIKKVSGFSIAAVAVISLIQLAYCITVYIKISAEPAEATTASV